MHLNCIAFLLFYSDQNKSQTHVYNVVLHDDKSNKTRARTHTQQKQKSTPTENNNKHSFSDHKLSVHNMHLQ